MPRFVLLPCLLTGLFFLGAAQAQHVRFVDPLLGADGGGNTFPGATLPFGMLKAGPDTGDNTANAGWTPDQRINGFSQMHVSGTGGGAKYGNVLVQPTVGAIAPGDHGSARADEHASAGFYSVDLTRYHVRVELASARRSAIYRFTYPASTEANLLIDAGHLLSSYANQQEDQRLVSSSVRVLSPQEIEGTSTITGGWNFQTSNYTVYFYARTDTPALSAGTWRDGQLQPGSKSEAVQQKSDTGAWFRFHTHAGERVQMKIGISFISLEQAKHNADTEIPAFDLDATRAAAERVWEKALSAVEIEGASEADRQQFYTAVYHSMLMPSDRTGENPLFQSSEPMYDDFYAIWDTFRTSSPLLTLIAQDRESGIVRGLVDLYRHEGWLPDARSGNYNGRVQGGSDADMTIADGYVKQLPGVDWNMAYQAVVHDAEVVSPQPLKEGRGDLDDWKRLGYLTIEGTDRPASKHMEYAADDYAIALMAKGLGKQSDFVKYSKRAGNWKNLWDTAATDQGFNGFVWPRHRDGSWKAKFDPLLTGTWGSDSFYEGNSWTYSTFVPQDVAGLIQASGGRDTFVKRMESFFDVPGRYDVGNEPGFLAPYLYLWAGRPSLTQTRIRSILAKNYHTGPKGLPGNDDSGAMSSWYVFGKMGFYPNAAQDVYLIGSPAFQRVTIHLANGHEFTVKTEGNAIDKPYVAGATWNGKPYNRAWFTHEELMRGGVLRLTMSARPSSWGAAELPPSMSRDVR
ncbi:MAG TPA: GH92 family glycosyl hydrolase [Acidobacteriaceae bacterium]|jgi:predicted alpha-1,2-mannosidase